MNLTHFIRKIIFAVITVIVLWSCEETTFPQGQSDYFPLETNRAWTYQRWLVSTGDEQTTWVLDTLRFRVTGDTLIQGHVYKKILNHAGYVEKVVRSEGSRYYGRRHELYTGFSDEYVFLDADKPAGSAWEYFKSEGTKTEYVIKTKNAHHTISGKVYEDVIEVEVNYYFQEQPGVYRYWLTSLHYYAKGAGEIYNHYPYPVSGYYANLESFLAPGNK